MANLNNITELVQGILEEHEDARDDDSFLYCYVLEHYGRKLGVNFRSVSVDSFFKAYRKYKIPSIESVGRLRRKVQEQQPELRGNQYSKSVRRHLEKEYREYARNY